MGVPGGEAEVSALFGIRPLCRAFAGGDRLRFQQARRPAKIGCFSQGGREAQGASKGDVP